MKPISPAFGTTTMKPTAHTRGKRGFKPPFFRVYQTGDSVSEGVFYAVNLRLGSGEQIPISGRWADSGNMLSNCRRDSWEQAARVLDELAREARVQADFYASEQAKAASEASGPSDPAADDCQAVREYHGTITHCVSPTGLVYLAQKTHGPPE